MLLSRKLCFIYQEVSFRRFCGSSFPPAFCPPPRPLSPAPHALYLPSRAHVSPFLLRSVPPPQLLHFSPTLSSPSTPLNLEILQLSSFFLPVAFCSFILIFTLWPQVIVLLSSAWHYRSLSDFTLPTRCIFPICPLRCLSFLVETLPALARKIRSTPCSCLAGRQFGYVLWPLFLHVTSLSFSKS